MKGTLVLTEGRSGSNWLISLTNGTDLLGNGGEWFANWFLRQNGMPRTKEELIARVLAKATTENGYFCIKVFPAHVHFIQIHYGFDLIKYFIDNHDTNLVRLTRADRFRQAISYARGAQTQQWTKNSIARGEARYDYDTICRCYFLLSRSDGYWHAYLGLRQIDATTFVYEELLDNPKGFVDCLSKHCGCELRNIPESKHSIQRDALTEAWLTRFVEDVEQNGIVEQSTASRRPPATISNLIRLIRGKALKPYPYAF